MRKTVLVLLAGLLILLSSCGNAALNGVPSYPDSVKLDVDYFTSRIMPAPPWTSLDGSSYSGGPFEGYRIDKSDYAVVKDPAKPGLKNFYDSKLDGWESVVDEKGKDKITGADYEMYAWKNGNKAFLIYALTGGENIILTQELSK